VLDDLDRAFLAVEVVHQHLAAVVFHQVDVLRGVGCPRPRAGSPAPVLDEVTAMRLILSGES
jgi:hypothetical protein